MRNLALCSVCGAHCATLNQSNQFLPVTRPLSVTGEREQCSILTEGGDASAWPPSCCIVAYKGSVEKRNTETMGRLVTQRFRPTRPPGRSGPLDRTAGGIGGAAPASLDLYGQSRTEFSLSHEWDSDWTLGRRRKSMLPGSWLCPVRIGAGVIHIAAFIV